MWLILVQLFLLSLVHSQVVWDDKGYILYCPCMGRFGNQAAHFLGALAFAKSLNRTLAIPPWRTYRNVPFKEWFKPEAVLNYHKSLPLEEFLEVFTDRWPPGQRIGYCYKSHKPDANDCQMKEGNPFGPFWTDLGVDFDRSVFTYLSYDQYMIQQWNERYPASLHPVLAFKGAPATFPVKKEHRSLQSYLVWSDTIMKSVNEYWTNVMKGVEYIGIHLRIGSDWKIACQHAVGTRSFMESLQCLEDSPNQLITDEICLPSTKRIITDIQSVIHSTGIMTLFIASDIEPPLNELQNELGSEVRLYYMKDNSLPQIDLAMLGKSNHFIGNCVSSFTAFVKRERDIKNLPSSFWGQSNSPREEL